MLQVVALFANDGAVLSNHKQVANTQESFCHLLFRWDILLSISFGCVSNPIIRNIQGVPQKITPCFGGL